METDARSCSALKRQLDCYQRLAKLANTQHEHVQNSRTEDLLVVLSQRQQLLEEMAQLEQIDRAGQAATGRSISEGLPPDSGRRQPNRC